MKVAAAIGVHLDALGHRFASLFLQKLCVNFASWTPLGHRKMVGIQSFSKKSAVEISKNPRVMTLEQVTSPCSACDSASFWLDPSNLVRCWYCSPPPFLAACRCRLTLVLVEGRHGLGVPTLEPRPADRKPDRSTSAPTPAPKAKAHQASILDELPDSVGLLARIFIIHNLKPRTDHSHSDPANWMNVKQREKGARIKTICSICYGFIGYRDPPRDGVETRSFETSEEGEEEPF